MDLDRDTADIKKDVESAKASAIEATTEIKKDVESAEASAREASETSSRMHNFLQEAEQSGREISNNKIGILAQFQGSQPAPSPQPSQTAPNPAQLEHFVDTRLLETLKNVLLPKQYSALQSRIGAEKKGGLRRQVFDAKNTTHWPGDLVRSEGDAPISDSAANEVYDNLEIIHRFFKDVWGWEIPDNKGKTLVVTIHYGKDFDNVWWDGQQIVLGDGDGEIFRKGGFTSLSIMAHEIDFAVNQYTARLAYQGQSGALLELSRMYSVVWSSNGKKTNS
jgi:Zn-dependent metalloprotease